MRPYLRTISRFYDLFHNFPIFAISNDAWIERKETCQKSIMLVFNPAALENFLTLVFLIGFHETLLKNIIHFFTYMKSVMVIYFIIKFKYESLHCEQCVWWVNHFFMKIKRLIKQISCTLNVRIWINLPLWVIPD